MRSGLRALGCPPYAGTCEDEQRRVGEEHVTVLIAVCEGDAMESEDRGGHEEPG